MQNRFASPWPDLLPKIFKASGAGRLFHWTVYVESTDIYEAMNSETGTPPPFSSCFIQRYPPSKPCFFHVLSSSWLQLKDFSLSFYDKQQCYRSPGKKHPSIYQQGRVGFFQRSSLPWMQRKGPCPVEVSKHKNECGCGHLHWAWLQTDAWGSWGRCGLCQSWWWLGSKPPVLGVSVVQKLGVLGQPELMGGKGWN